MAPKRQLVVDHSQISAIDWARLAAFIDGEGTITSQLQTMSGGKYRTEKLVVQVANTDIRIPAWCQRTFGGALCKYKASSVDAKPYAVWTVGSLMAEEIIHGCMPYFLAKQEQAQVALLFRSTFSLPGYWTTPEQLQRRSELANELSRLKHDLPEEGKVLLQ